MSELLFKISGLLIIVAVLSLSLKAKSSEYSFLTALAAAVICAVLLLSRLIEPLKELDGQFAAYGINTDYFKVALKAVGISYVSTFISDACRDCGHSALASTAIFAGKTAIFLLTVPLIVSVCETAVGFLK